VDDNTSTATQLSTLANAGGAVIKSNEVDVISSVNFDLKMAL
jgi:hypothetical protein